MIIGWRSILTTIRSSIPAVALLLAFPTIPQAKAEVFDGPSFRKGLWHFVRTLDLVAHRKAKHRVMEREVTACVDPTVSMKATFDSPSVGSCVSAKPEKNANQYTFAKRCDFMGPVSTVITVDSEESYTEQNELQGSVPRVEKVVAKRIGDCDGGAEKHSAAKALPH